MGITAGTTRLSPTRAVVHVHTHAAVHTQLQPPHTGPTLSSKQCGMGMRILSQLCSPSHARRWQSSDAEAAPASRPWFYPVVEQHDVTYHRVKPLAGHRERRRAGAPAPELGGAAPPRRSSRERQAWGSISPAPRQILRPSWLGLTGTWGTPSSQDTARAVQ